MSAANPTEAACTGEPISWLRLEQHALEPDAAIDAHLAACPACRHCLDEIRGDLVALPALVVPERRRHAWFRWWQLAIPALAAAAIALVVVRPKPEPRTRRMQLAGVKGVGDVALGLVRDRDGAIRDDVATYRPGDRWKVVVTCGAAGGVWIDVAVLEAGAAIADRPLAPARIACGNAVPVPGAFVLTGTRPNRICVRASADPAGGVAPSPDQPDVACVTALPEAP